MWRWVWVGLVGCNGAESQDRGEPTDLDLDDDGYEADEDCDDEAVTVHPGALEEPYDGVDQDCADGDLVDVDEDGFDAVEAGGDDCDDGEATVFPGAEEVAYDDIDQDCSGEDLVDLDGDGFGSDDCDDADPTVNPDAVEVWYDGVDQDCRADCDYDVDRDGAVGAEWVADIVDGSTCDRDPSAEIRVLEDCDDSDPNASTQRVTSVNPADGAVGVDVFGGVDVRLQDNEQSAQVRLLDADGNPMASDMYFEAGDWMVLIPLDPSSGQAPYALDGFTTFTVEVTHSCGVETTTFTTGEGLVPVDPFELVGTTWELLPTLGIGYINWSPLNYFGPSDFGLLTVSATDGVTIDLIVAAPDANGNQDLCVPTGEVHGLDFSDNPRIRTTPFDYPMSFGGPAGPVSYTNQQGVVSGTLFDGGLISVELTGLIETHEVSADAGVGVNQACNMFGCVACPDGSGATCLPTDHLLYGELPLTAVPIVSRTAADIAADPSCP